MSSYIEKPTTIYTAIGVLWIWLGVMAVTCIYNDATSGPKMHEMMQTTIASMGGLAVPDAGEGGGIDLNAMSPTLEKTFLWAQVGFDILTIASFAGIIYEIGEGRKWARFTLAISLLFDIGIFAFSLPETPVDWVTSVLNLVLESWALWLLYSAKGSKWFNRPKEN